MAAMPKAYFRFFSTGSELTGKSFFSKMMTTLGSTTRVTKTFPSSRLNRFFDWLIRRSFQDLRIKEPTVARYIASLLAEFARTDNLYKIRSLQGKRLETVVELLSETKMLEELGSEVEKEREIYKHTGDYILFMSGIFREYVERNAFLRYYMGEGERAYQGVFDRDLMLHRPASLFLELARRFEFYSGAVHYMKKTFFIEGGVEDPFLDFASQVGLLA